MSEKSWSPSKSPPQKDPKQINGTRMKAAPPAPKKPLKKVKAPKKK